MQFVSIYRLAELCDINTDRLDIFSMRDIQSALKKLYPSDDIELFHIGNNPVTVKVADDWLWKSNSSDALSFCQWVHEIPGLENYLERNVLNYELSTEIPDKILKSFNFSRFGNFLSPFLDDAIQNDIKDGLLQRDFKKVNALLDFKPLLSRNAQSDLDSAISESLDALVLFFQDFENTDNINDTSGFKFLVSTDFKKFFDTIESNFGGERERLKIAIEKGIQGLKRTEDNELREEIASIFDLHIVKQFKTPEIKIFQDKPSVKSTPKKTVTQIKQGPSNRPKQTIYPKSSTGPKISPWHFIGIAFAVFALIFKIAMHNTESSYDYSNYTLPDYDTDEFGSSGYFSKFNWDNNIDIIKAYVEENENKGDFEISAMSDWYNEESEEAITEPFNEFFYPLYNKDGLDGFNIVNESNYAVIILVKGDDDCYSYLAESKSSYEEYFDLEKDDELMFYFGKEYEETEDLDESDIAGFHYVDHNSLMYLDSVYTIGYGIHPDRDNEDESFDFEIRINEKNGLPQVSFDYYRTVTVEESYLF